jgi:hypothetical protein
MMPIGFHLVMSEALYFEIHSQPPTEVEISRSNIPAEWWIGTTDPVDCSYFFPFFFISCTTG